MKNIILNSTLPPFTKKCYLKLLKIPKGNVITYKNLAKSLNSKAYRAVGTAMKNNPYAPLVPCHRVVRSDGTVGQYAKGIKVKLELLKTEGIKFKGDKILDLEKVLIGMN